MSVQTHVESNLQQAVAALIRREIAAFLALSLIFAVPLSCQQHDMMSLLDLHMQHDIFMNHADHAQHNNHDQSSGQPQVDIPQPVSAVAATLAAFAGVLPPTSDPVNSVIVATLLPTELPYPSQHHLIPPDQPPRSV
jgi:hypothetical protein